ncbi:hypothetical protein NX059_011509 [Plenodomus lindquistii]|nr:hypothetical protein NX059_011509 [Plenodomus lindquistii]
MSDLLAGDPALNSTMDWNVFSHSDSFYLGDASQMLTGAPATSTSTEDMTNLGVMSCAMIATPMTQEHSHSGSSFTSKDRMSSSPEQSSYYSKLAPAKSSPLAPEPSKVEKRKANTLAARRYRQKRVDAMSSLEAELKDVKTERDDYKVRCAKLEGEVEALRALLRTQK